MFLRIDTINEKKLIGQIIKTSLANNRTFELWKKFMPRRREIKNNLNTDLIAMQLYDKDYFKNFDPKIEFEKWATVEVKNFDDVPNEMETFTLKAGVYAVFLHNGAASEGEKTFRYIFEKWLPGSEFELDGRPHFEILGEKYKNEDAASEEEIWIPVKSKSL